jgi:hypothetical protein
MRTHRLIRAYLNIGRMTSHVTVNSVTSFGGSHRRPHGSVVSIIEQKRAVELKNPSDISKKSVLPSCMMCLQSTGNKNKIHISPNVS